MILITTPIIRPGKISNPSSVSEGSISENAFFNPDLDLMPLGELTTSTTNQPFASVDPGSDGMGGGRAHVSSGPSGVGPRSGDKCIRILYQNGQDEQGSYFYVDYDQFPSGPNNTIYARWWEFYEGWAGQWPLALKNTRFFSATSGDPYNNLDYPYLGPKISNQFDMGSDGDLFCRGLNHATGNNDHVQALSSDTLFGNGLPYIREGRWYKYELWAEFGSVKTAPGSNDGTLQFWIDDVQVMDINDLNYWQEQTLYDKGWSTMYFGGNYSGSTFGAPGADLYRYLDDLYLSPTKDR